MKKRTLKFIERIGFSEEQLGYLTQNYQRFSAQTPNINGYEYLCRNLFDENYDLSILNVDISLCSKQSDIKEGTFNLLFFLENLEKLHELYSERDIEERLFFDMIKDFKYKADEFYSLKGYVGTHFNAWHAVFFRLQRFALGRFQYDLVEFSYPQFAYGNVKVEKGETVVNVHIPSGGKMTREDRLASYKMAYDFYKKRGVFTDGVMKLVCHTWMLFPPYKKLFPKTSNIYDFTEEFTYLYTDPRETFTDGWRIFGKEYNDQYKNLPRNTSLQRAFADYLSNGKPIIGVGYSILLFDGEKIL